MNEQMFDWGVPKRRLDFIWICDCSGSMDKHGKIQGLNEAIRETLPHVRNWAESYPLVEVFMRAIKFSCGAAWHAGTPTLVSDFVWTDLTAGGGRRDMGKALKMVADGLKMPPMPERACPPILVLVTDGEPTDDWGTGLKELLDQPWGKKAVRVGIALGSDVDPEVLQEFIGRPELAPFRPNTLPEDLIRFIHQTFTTVGGAPAGRHAEPTSPPSYTPIPLPPLPDDFIF